MNRKIVLRWLSGVWLVFIALRMLYYHLHFHLGYGTILPYFWVNPFIDWIPMIFLGSYLLYSNFRDLNAEFQNLFK